MEWDLLNTFIRKGYLGNEEDSPLDLFLYRK